jgi:hypothetical protein
LALVGEWLFDSKAFVDISYYGVGIGTLSVNVLIGYRRQGFVAAIHYHFFAIIIG